MTFSENFREHVVPRLVAEIKQQATSLACDMIDWQDAFQAVFDVACRYGAMHLPDLILYDLREWIGSTLLDEVGNAEIVAATIERHEQADPIGHYESLAASSANPDAMRWVFASISREYRNSLLSVKRMARAGAAGGA